jgi:hypothetical protein
LAAAAAARHSCVLVAAPVSATILWLKCVGIGGGKCVVQAFGVSGDGCLMEVHNKAMTAA